MKKISSSIIACLLAVLMTALTPLSVFAQGAQNADNTGKYISEIRIGMGEDAASAAASLSGYTILSENGNNVDLNQSAGGGFASKGEKVVYLGYKTTDDMTQAITDLAVMNMKGGYSVQDYEAMFDSYLKAQIEPLAERLTTAIKEYRVNYSSENESNQKRAAFVHDALNKLIDDDTKKGLGDLLLNPTKYELGDEAYEALSETMKKNTADIVTILAQANGKATLMIENFIARAADTSDDTWIDRFAATTYDDLLDELCDREGMFPSDAQYELDRRYVDDAEKLSMMLNRFRAVLAGYDDALEIIENYDSDATEQEITRLDKVIDELSGLDDPSEQQTAALERALEDRETEQDKTDNAAGAMKTIAVHAFLDNIEYGGSTLAEFFSRRADDVELKELYPMAASLSEGQKAGLDFISLPELVAIAMTDGEGYGREELSLLSPVSIYEDVDRGIYEKGGVAVTSEALRIRALETAEDNSMTFSTLSLTAYTMTGLTLIALIPSASHMIWYNATHPSTIEGLKTQLMQQRTKLVEQMNSLSTIVTGDDGNFVRVANQGKEAEVTALKNRIKDIDYDYDSLLDPNASTNYHMPISEYLTIGLTIGAVLFTIVGVFSTYQDLKAYYNLEFTPVPHYMVDENDITAYDAKGEKIFIKNQTAYYKSVECNRTKADEMYDSIGTCADLNGDVGSQWLALYYVKQEPSAPILASSLRAVVGDDNLPANYTTGIHMFGSVSAFNLNNSNYVWNGEAPSVYVYFNVDDDAKRSIAGSLFAGGQMALVAGVGIVVGALGAVLVTCRRGRKKEEEAA